MRSARARQRSPPRAEEQACHGECLRQPLVHEGRMSDHPTGGLCVCRAPVARRTAVGSLAHGCSDRRSRSQLRVSVGLAPTSPVPDTRDRPWRPDHGQPLSRATAIGSTTPREQGDSVEAHAQTAVARGHVARVGVRRGLAIQTRAEPGRTCVAGDRDRLARGRRCTASTGRTRARLPGARRRSRWCSRVLRVALTALTTHGERDVLVHHAVVHACPTCSAASRSAATINGPVVLAGVAESARDRRDHRGVRARSTRSSRTTSSCRPSPVRVPRARPHGRRSRWRSVPDDDRRGARGARGRPGPDRRAPVRRGRLLRQIVPVLESGLERGDDARGVASTPVASRVRRWHRGPNEAPAGAAPGALLLVGAFVACWSDGSRRPRRRLGLRRHAPPRRSWSPRIASDGRARYRPRRMDPRRLAGWSGSPARAARSLASPCRGRAERSSGTPSPLRWPRFESLVALAARSRCWPRSSPSPGPAATCAGRHAMTSPTPSPAVAGAASSAIPYRGGRVRVPRRPRRA